MPLPVDERQHRDGLRKADALISYYLHIPHPELLDTATWQDKAGQANWLHQNLNQH